MKNLLNIFIFPLFVLCSFLQMNVLSSEKKIGGKCSPEDKNQIGYLFFKVEKNDPGLEKITLEDRKLTEGKLKSTPVFDRNSAGIGDFVVLLTDSNGKEFVKQLVENPLNQNLESFDKEGIRRHKVSLETAEFSIRYPHASEIQVVRIEKITRSGNQLLFNQKL